jgi:hypothetical protein
MIFISFMGSRDNTLQQKTGRFFTARQVPERIFNETSKNTENDIIEWLQKKITRYTPQTKLYGFESNVKNCFWNLSSTPGFS